MKQFKLWMSMFVLFFVGASVCAAAADTNGEIRLFVDGELKSLTQAPVMHDQVIYLPMKDVFSLFGAGIELQADERKVHAAFDDRQLFVDLESLQISMQRGEQVSDTFFEKAKIHMGRVMIPLTVVAESLDVHIEYSEELEHILIESDIEILQNGDEVVESKIYADLLSFFIEEVTDNTLAMAEDTYDKLIENGTHFFGTERSEPEQAFIEAVEEVTIEQLFEKASPSESSAVTAPSDIVKLAALKVETIEEKEIGHAEQLTVVSGVFQDDNETEGLLFYVGEVEFEAAGLLDFIGLPIGKTTMSYANVQETARELIVVIAGTFLFNESAQTSN